MSDLAILFGRPRRAPEADDRFELEVLAAEELGMESYAIPLDRVVDGEPERALRSLPRPRGRRWLYRGWMLSEEEYTALYASQKRESARRRAPRERGPLHGDRSERRRLFGLPRGPRPARGLPRPRAVVSWASGLQNAWRHPSGALVARTSGANPNDWRSLVSRRISAPRLPGRSFMLLSSCLSPSCDLPAPCARPEPPLCGEPDLWRPPEVTWSCTELDGGVQQLLNGRHSNRCPDCAPIAPDRPSSVTLAAGIEPRRKHEGCSRTAA